MSQIKLNQIKEELLKIKDFESLKKEIKKLIIEIEKFDFKKAIPEEQVEYFEKKYKEMMKTISTVQSKVEKEVDKTMRMVSSRKEEAFQILKDAQKQAFKQKRELENMLQTNFNFFAKKAKESFKTEEKQIKRTIRKVRKTAVVKAKKSLNKKTTKKK